MTETSDRSNRWKPRLVRSFRVSEDLEEMIKQECKRRNTDFSSFMRAGGGAKSQIPLYPIDKLAVLEFILVPQ
jgi:hypothetical protein